MSNFKVGDRVTAYGDKGGVVSTVPFSVQLQSGKTQAVFVLLDGERESRQIFCSNVKLDTSSSPPPEAQFKVGDRVVLWNGKRGVVSSDPFDEDADIPRSFGQWVKVRVDSETVDGAYLIENVKLDTSVPSSHKRSAEVAMPAAAAASSAAAAAESPAKKPKHEAVTSLDPSESSSSSSSTSIDCDDLEYVYRPTTSEYVDVEFIIPSFKTPINGNTKGRAWCNTLDIIRAGCVVLLDMMKAREKKSDAVVLPSGLFRDHTIMELFFADFDIEIQRGFPTTSDILEMAYLEHFFDYRNDRCANAAQWYWHKRLVFNYGNLTPTELMRAHTITKDDYAKTVCAHKVYQDWKSGGSRRERQMLLTPEVLQFCAEQWLEIMAYFVSGLPNCPTRLQMKIPEPTLGTKQ